MASKLRMTLTRSGIGLPKDQKATVRALGLKRMHQTVEHDDTRAVRGMWDKVRHMVTLEEVD
jgi:large subunit ribosomal protein L30